MPSFTSLLKASALVLISSHLTAAAPYWIRPTPIEDLVLPTTNTSATLPTTTLSLVYVAVGRGIQNYSCASVGAAPVAVGAIATLYDATPLAEWSMDVLNSIPGSAVNDAPPAAGQDYTLPAPANDLALLGHHYFAADGTPTFDLTSVSKLLYGSKNGDIKAPANAPVGPAGTGAVDWLSLVAKASYDASIGLGQVYRVETAGGSAPASCTSTDLITVQYSAEYWFYA